MGLSKFFIPKGYAENAEQYYKPFSESIAGAIPFEEILPDREDEECGGGVIIYNNGDVGFGLKLHPIYLDSLRIEERHAFRDAVHLMIESLSSPIECAQVVWKKIPYDAVLDLHENIAQSEDPIVSDMAAASIEYWRDRFKKDKTYGIECTIWFRIPMERTKKVSNLSRFFGIAPDEEIAKYMKDQRHICDRLIDRVKILLSKMNSLRFVTLHRMTAQEIVNTIYHSIFREYRPNIPYDRRTPFRVQLGKKDFGVSYSYISTGNNNNKILGVLTAQGLPEESFIIMINVLLALPQPLTVSMTFGEIPRAQAEAQLAIQLKRFEATGFNEARFAAARKSAEEGKRLIEEMQNIKQNIYAFEIAVVCEADTWLALQVRMEAIIGAGNEMDIKFVRENAALFAAFLSSLPGFCKHSTTARSEWVKTENVADMLPLYGPVKSASYPVMLLGGPYDTVWGYNPRDSRLDAYHSIIAGGTGSGKSFFMILLLMSYMALDPRIYIIDRGVGDSASYRKLTDLLEGEYISVAGGKVSFNPFEGLINEVNDEESFQMARITVEMILTEIVSGETREHMSAKKDLVNRLVTEIIRKWKDNRYIIPTLSMAYDMLSRGVTLYNPSEDTNNAYRIAIEDMKRLLGRWCQTTSGGSMQAMLLDNKETTVSLDNRIVVFDLQGVEKHPELMRVIILCINDIIMRGCINYKGQPKILAMDEAWAFLEMEEGAAFAKDMYKTARKYNMSVISISQSLGDFTNNNLKDTILSQSHQKFIFKLADDVAVEGTRLAVGLHPDQKELLHLSKVNGVYSEMLAIFSYNTGPVITKLQVRPSAYSYWIATTRPEDLQLLDEYRSKGMPLEQALTIAAKDFPRGVEELQAGRAVRL